MKPRIVLELLGLLLQSLLIWFTGPYVAFADYRPLEADRPRVVAIALLVAMWAALKLLNLLKASRASRKLASAVTAQADAEASSDEPQLRARFEEAIAALKETRGRHRNLYYEPWYVIIGAPGSGKSTLLQNSGLRFLLDKKFGRDAVRGVGGTRNCDWWFTGEAIFLDTAGRFTTQDSDPCSDARSWREFLALLKKFRSRRPVNGIILTVSVGDLLTLTAAGRHAQIAAVRRRLDELNRELRIRLPIYLLVTKCDLMSGFTEYFADLPAQARKQVWGATFPCEQTLSVRAPQLFAAEFEQLVGRLNERLWQRLQEEPEARRRAKIFTFPQQLAALQDVLNEFVTEVFAGTRRDAPALLRGVYFTSGTQEGTPIDRLLGYLGRAFAFERQEMPRAAAARGKAYFIERLLKEVVLPESGLAGVNHRRVLRIAGAQLVTYVGLGVITVLIAAALTVSYTANRHYLDSVRRELARVDTTALHPAAPVKQLAARLDQIRGLAEAAGRYHGTAPWNMRWGLYAGNSLGQAAQDAYRRMLNGLLVPRIATLFAQELDRHVRKPETTLYEYLKAYLMLGGKGPLEGVYLETLTDSEWQSQFASDPTLVEDLKGHSASLFADSRSVRPAAIDSSAVDQARNTIRHTPGGLPALLYDELKTHYPVDGPDALRLDNAAGLALSETLARRGGRSWKTPMSSLYTKKVFDKVSAPTGTAELVTRFTQEGWVLGDDAVSLAHAPELTGQVLDLYESDYISAWDQVVNDLQLPPLSDTEQLKTLLATLSSKEGSPLRGLLQTIDENTHLVAGAPQAGPRPGTRVTEHFASIHALLSGPPGQAPIDAVLDKLAAVARGISSCGPGTGHQSAEQCARQDPASVQALGQEAQTLPAGVGSLVAVIATVVDRAQSAPRP